MHLITPELRGYAWGTTDDIAGLLGLEPTGAPIAEAWWGAHESGPSVAHTPDGVERLDALIAAQAESCLGGDCARRWGDRLPFLLKLLAINKPLSIQVHPTTSQARAGFEEERRDAAATSYAFEDPFHKPEMVFALTSLRVLAGVRPVHELRADLESLGTAGAKRLAGVLTDDISDFISLAFAGAGDAETLAALAERGSAAPEGSSLRVSADALAAFPGDAGAIVALALNVVDLAAGESLFIGAGVLHSYQAGLGIEVMANSDNVVRAGLTPKHVDVPLLLSLASTRSAPAARPHTQVTGAAVTLLSEADEFALTVVTDGHAEVPAGPRVVLVVQGEASLACAAESTSLQRGQAVFARHSEGPIRVSARGTTVIAHLPERSSVGDVRIS
ncbi:mannose-6-phosphate isomerase, class I [Demequina aestuarii]|uniref:mannose-6-phosphate isomerase, class I n=1 Tax=Demequina aestuarii TaxID=327095 RepID=UPI00187C7739|nr:mannose-6-phosphate isomerase, class I [Demequina aestuarii]